MSMLYYLRRAATGRRLRSALLVASVAAGMLLSTGAAAASASPPAQSTAVVTATTAADTCPARALCLYDEVGFGGQLFTVASLNPGGSCVSLVDHGWGGRARSAINTFNTSAAMFSNDGCASGPFQVPGNSSLSSFGTYTPDSVWVPYWLS